MSDEYIRRQEMLEAVDHLHIIPSIDGTGKPTPAEDFRVQFIGTVLKVKSADVVQVVRCKDCKHVYCRIYHWWQEPIYTCTHLRSRWNRNNDLEVNPDDFCSYGERKEE